MARGGKPRIQAPPGFWGCTRCGEIKPVSEFKRKVGRNNAVVNPCKACGKIKRLEEPLSPWGSVVRRFWQKVDKSGPNGCWLWTGAKNNVGRPQLYIGGPKQMEIAYRISLQIHGVEVPCRWESGMVPDHICKVGLCVNPDHLRIVTEAENTVDFAYTTVFHKNKARTHCAAGHEFTPENTAVVERWGKTRHGHPQGKPNRSRQCLTCHPHFWRFCMVPRTGPPGTRQRGEWVGPQTKGRQDDRV